MNKTERVLLRDCSTALDVMKQTKLPSGLRVPTTHYIAALQQRIREALKPRKARKRK